jgi:nucleoside-diphosphate-sugar epimerase
VGVVLRFALFYGPDSHHTRDLIRLVRLGWAPSVGSPDAFISSIATDDAATAVMSALHAAPGAYNVADDSPVRKREYFDSLAGALGVSHPRFLPGWITALSGSMGETLSRSQRLSNLKLRGLGWAPRLPSVHEGWRVVVDELHTVHPVPAPAPG